MCVCVLEYLLECPSAEVRQAFAKTIVFCAHFSLRDSVFVFYSRKSVCSKIFSPFLLIVDFFLCSLLKVFLILLSIEVNSVIKDIHCLDFC